MGAGRAVGNGHMATLYQETATLFRTGQKLYISKILSNRCPWFVLVSKEWGGDWAVGVFCGARHTE